jgi:2-octaprenyl-6-methoxyphenol hydroxylase
MSPLYDIAIVGGGMVGASLTRALAPLELDVALIEAVPHDAQHQPSFDERTTALSNGSQRILAALGAWPAAQDAATAIRKIHVSDQGRFGFARIDAAEQGLAAMGYVVPNRVLGQALWQGLEAAHTRLYCPASVAGVAPGAAEVELSLRRGGTESRIRARLVVAADGAQSALRDAFGVGAEVADYGQSAVITTVLPQRFHDHVAYERFTPQGPLALLPLADGRCTLVLTVPSAQAGEVLAWPDTQFLGELQQRFGFRLGRFLQVGRRTAYPLALTRSAQTSAPRCVIVGNAAQSLHPVAGMGFNLGLRDVASLAELIAEQRRLPGFDPGAAALLSAYDAWRAADRRGVIAFTDILVRSFSSRLGSIRRLRNVALLAFDLLPPAKAALSRLSAGGGERIPKLARGVALT